MVPAGAAERHADHSHGDHHCPVCGRVQALPPHIRPRDLRPEQVHHGGGEFPRTQVVTAIGPHRLLSRGISRLRFPSFLFIGCNFRGTHSTFPSYDAHSGSHTRKVDPFPTSLSHAMRPSWRSTISFTIANPRPEPWIFDWLTFRPRKNRSNKCGKSSASMPIPVSFTSSQTPPSAGEVRTQIEP